MMRDNDNNQARTTQQKGYRFMLWRLNKARRMCGREAVVALLRGHGASNVTDVKPQLYNQIGLYAEAMVLSAACLDHLLDGLPPKPQRGTARHVTRSFRESVDQWLDACETQMQFTYPKLYVECGAPIHTPNCKNG